MRLQQLQEAVQSSDAQAATRDPFLRRLAGALSARSASAADIAGLVRQGMLRAESIEGQEVALLVPHGAPWPDHALWQRFSCEVQSRRGAYLIRPRPWIPAWLDTGAPRAIDAAIQETPRRVARSVEADPAVTAHLGWDHYVSAGQRAAVHAAYLTPAGSTTLIALPTGSGKSLAFQLPALTFKRERGFVLVIVPTVALARDQEARFRELLKDESLQSIPLAYHSGLDEAQKAALISGIRSGDVPIVFASPEAAIKSLRDALFDVARQGRLKLFAIDEAHLVAQWGEEFRPDFQSIAGLRDALLEACPAAARFRTLLLTATVTQEGLATLRAVFGRESFEFVGEIALRPEIAYLLNHAPDEPTRTARVLEAIDHLPRPLILYVTVRKHAEQYYDQLRARGYTRLRLVRGGDLTGEEGAQVLEEWRARKVDIIVATSAFGVGMDQSEIRSIVHACLPETIDRYYQEVGRAGRDGNAAVALLASAPEDRIVARQLAERRRIGVKRGFERWEAMWWHKVAGPADLHLLPLGVSPPNIPVPGVRSEAWNMRTLVLMARAGLIAFAAHAPPHLEPTPGEDPVQFEHRRGKAYQDFIGQTAVRILDFSHLDRAHWDHLVRKMRTRLRLADRRAMQWVAELLNLQRPLNDLFREVYELIDPPRRAPRLFGSCPVTRAQGIESFLAASPEVDGLTRTDLGPTENLERILAPCLDAAHRAWITYAPPAEDGLSARRWRTEIAALLQNLARQGVVEMAVPRGVLAGRDWDQIQARSPARFVVRGTFETENEPTLFARVSILDRTQVQAASLDRLMRLDRRLHLVVLPHGVTDPWRQGAGLLDRIPYMTLDELKRRMGQ